jgi:hypothetical protein
MTVDFEPICHLCQDCKLSDECPLARMFPIFDCQDFDDGYRGPEYPDGDAYREQMEAQLFGEIDESTSPPK